MVIEAVAWATNEGSEELLEAATKSARFKEEWAKVEAEKVERDPRNMAISGNGFIMFALPPSCPLIIWARWGALYILFVSPALVGKVVALAAQEVAP